MTKSNLKTTLNSIKMVRELTKILNENDLSQIKIEEGDIKIVLSRKNQSLSNGFQDEKSKIQENTESLNTKINKKTIEDINDLSSQLDAVKSPMVGTAYTRPSPDADPFVKVNDKVKEGDTIILIEAMKTFNSITASKSGTIRKIIIENAQPVEFGDPLFIIE
ncbi:MAG: acetyl-CoA carboxylase biotin carboxyl carrier protein [Hellea sp.]